MRKTFACNAPPSELCPVETSAASEIMEKYLQKFLHKLSLSPIVLGIVSVGTNTLVSSMVWISPIGRNREPARRRNEKNWRLEEMQCNPERLASSAICSPQNPQNPQNRLMGSSRFGTFGLGTNFACEILQAFRPDFTSLIQTHETSYLT